MPLIVEANARSTPRRLSDSDDRPRCQLQTRRRVNRVELAPLWGSSQLELHDHGQLFIRCCQPTSDPAPAVQCSLPWQWQQLQRCASNTYLPAHSTHPLSAPQPPAA